MGISNIPDVLIELTKILGGVVRDTMDVGNYRITFIIERKIDDGNGDRTGVVIEHISVDKRMNALEVDVITKRIKELINK